MLLASGRAGDSITEFVTSSFDCFYFLFDTS